MEPHDDIVVGVDAGGTKTTAWLGRRDHETNDEPLGRGNAGPGNPRAAGIETATQSIAAAIEAAFQDADLSIAPAAAICLSVAGAGRPEEQQQLTSWAISQQLARQVTVTHDAAPVLAAASCDNIGIALISGTGSLAWGRSADGTVERVGGWGYLFGDEGSGYAIATDGLRAAARAADGRAPATVLLDAFMQSLDVATPSGLIESVYGATLSRQQIAALASIVFDASCDDEVAQGILSAASADLALVVTTLAQKLKFTSGEFMLGLAGGVLMNRPEFRSDVIQQAGLPPDHAINVPCPVAGSLAIARLLANGSF